MIQLALGSCQNAVVVAESGSEEGSDERKGDGSSMNGMKGEARWRRLSKYYWLIRCLKTGEDCCFH